MLKYKLPPKPVPSFQPYVFATPAKGAKKQSAEGTEGVGDALKDREGVGEGERPKVTEGVLVGEGLAGGHLTTLTTLAGPPPTKITAGPCCPVPPTPALIKAEATEIPTGFCMAESSRKPLVVEATPVPNHVPTIPLTLPTVLTLLFPPSGTRSCPAGVANGFTLRAKGPENVAREGAPST